MHKTPPEWDDDMRMNVLFAPFRDRSLNTKGWDLKLKFWSELIAAECTECQQAILDIEYTREKFKRKGKMPSCIHTVFEEMLRSGQLVRLSDVENQQQGWLSWSYRKLVKDPVVWGMKWLAQATEEVKPEEKFVLMAVIKSKAQMLMDTRTRLAQEEVTSIVEFSELREQNAQLCPTDAEFNLVMKQLCDAKQAVIQQKDNHTKYVKFMIAEKSPKEKNKEDIIEEKDIQLHKIHKTTDVLKKQIQALTEETKRLAAEAVSYKQEGHMKLAMSSMRKRKMAQNRIDKLTGSMDTLNDILYRIQQAESNEMVVRAIESGSSVLKDITGKTSSDEVANIMDNLADVTASQDDIMSELSTSTYIDEPSQEELEEELSAILDDSLTKNTSKAVPAGLDESTDIEKELQDIMKLDDVLLLPDVPTHSPGQAPAKMKQQALTS